MRNLLLLALSAILLAPTLARAANAQAQEYDELGMALYRQGLYAKANTYFQNAVQADPTDWEGYENLGNSYYKINDTADALSAYQKSLQLNPNNSTLENIVQSLQGNNATASNQPANNTPAASNVPVNNPSVVTPPPAGAAPPTTPQSSVENEQPIDNGQANAPQAGVPAQPGTTIVVRRRRRVWNPYPSEPVYNDNLASIDHAKFWTKVQIGYTFASMGDFINGAANINNGSYVNADLGLPVAYNGAASASNNGAHAGAEIGILLNPTSGISLGIKYAQLNNYTANVAYNDSYGDYENATLAPYVVPLTLNYYLFMPDSSGRFYIKGGVGYYFGDVNVNEAYSYSNFYNQEEASYPKTVSGDLTSGAIGFQLGIGREFEVSPRFGIEVYVEGHYSKITNFQGTLYDQNGNAYSAGLAAGNTNGTIDFDNPSFITSANGEHYATLDYTGFDAGISFNWYSF